MIDQKSEIAVIGIACRRIPPARSGLQFTHATLAPYVEALSGAGAATVLLPIQTEALAFRALSRCDGLLLAGGDDVMVGAQHLPRLDRVPGDAGRDRHEIALTHAALEWGLPILCICRGTQILNIALGGTIARVDCASSPRVDHMGREGAPARHFVTVVSDSLLAAACAVGGSFEVNSSHGWCVSAVAPALRVVARANDGVIEGVELKSAVPCIGVQWHPELLLRQENVGAFALFRWLVNESARASGRAR